jgi:hypothetical protein
VSLSWPKETTPMNTQSSLKSALFSFFQVGVMPPHRGPTDYEAPRPVSLSPFKPLRSA